jgi:hypothetical protein
MSGGEIEGGAWQPIATAPKDGTVFLGLYQGVATLAAWSFRRSRETTHTSTGWLWWKTSTVTKTDFELSGWYMAYAQPDDCEFRYSVFGDEIRLTEWTPLPARQDAGK